MKLVNWFIRLLSNTIGQWHFPFVDKEFLLEDYFPIEKYIRNLESPFVVGIVKTKGHGSNLLIGIAQCFSKKRCFRVTHALAHVGLYKGYKHRVIESIGEGIREVPLLKAIGQRDEVILRRPDPHLINHKVCEHAMEYLKAVAERDAISNIEYDNDHNYSIISIEEIRDHSSKNVKMDCSETVMQALEHGFKMTGQKSLIKMVDRAGKKSWAPSDIFHSELFITFYDSRKGFTNG